MNRKLRAGLGTAVAAALALSVSACVSDEPLPEVTELDTFPTQQVEITFSGWSLDNTPEFQTLADGFHALHPNVTVTVKEYPDSNGYDTQLIPDLAAHVAPDVYVIKNLKNFYTFQNNGQLQDVSDIADALPAETGGVDFYKIDGKAWAVPYRQDSWVLYYNKDLFDLAGVDYPDGSWTWDTYAEVAKDLTTKLKAAGSSALGTYEHSWQSTVQGFALAQTPGAKLDTGDYQWEKAYYNRVLDLQNAGAQAPLADIGSKLQGGYQARFGGQEAAMLPMGSWFVATLLDGQSKGTYQNFNWAFAPAPQFDASTAGLDKTPVTFGDPTGLGINPDVTDPVTFTVAKEFIRYAAGPEGAKALAKIGITPANTSGDVATIFFANGAPSDDLSKFAWSVHNTLPENPVTKYTAEIQTLLGQLHTSILTGEKSVDQAVADAENQAKTEILNK